MGVADCAAGGAGAFPGRFPRTRDEPTGGGASLHPREAGDIVHLGEQHEAEDRAKAGHRLEQRQGLGVMVLRGFDDGALDVTQQRIVGGDEGAIDGKAFWTAGSAQRSATPSRVAL